MEEGWRTKWRSRVHSLKNKISMSSLRRIQFQFRSRRKWSKSTWSKMLLNLQSTSRRIKLHQNSHNNLKTVLLIKPSQTKTKRNSLKWSTSLTSFQQQLNSLNNSPINNLHELTHNLLSCSLVIPHLLYLNTLCRSLGQLQDLSHQLVNLLLNLKLKLINNLKVVNRCLHSSFNTIQALNLQHLHLQVQMPMHMQILMPKQLQTLNKAT